MDIEQMRKKQAEQKVIALKYLTAVSALIVLYGCVTLIVDPLPYFMQNLACYYLVYASWLYSHFIESSAS